MSRTNPAELRCVSLVTGDPDGVLLHRRERGALRRAVAISCSLLALAVAMTVAAVPSHAAVRRGGGGHFAAPHFGGGHFHGGGHFAAPHFGGGHFHGGGHFAAPHFGGGHFHGGGHFAAPHFGGGHFGGGQFHGRPFHGGQFHGGQFHGGQFHGGQFHGRPFHGRPFRGGQFRGGQFRGGQFRGGQFRGGQFPAARMGGWHGDPRGDWRGGWHGDGWQGDGWRDGWQDPDWDWDWGWGWGGPGFGWNGALWVGGDWGGMYWPPVNYDRHYPWYLGSIPTGAVMLSFSGVPYYYINRVYYTWSPYYQGYVVTDPPPVANNGAGPQASTQTYTAGGGSGVLSLRVTPQKGQSRQQTANDQYACHKWAVAQSGFNPMRPAQDANASAHVRAGYQRAMIACLHARGYSVQGGGAGN